MIARETVRLLFRMASSTPRYSVAHAALWGVMNLSWLLPALIAQRFFDALTGEAPFPGGTTGPIVLLAVLALGQAGLWLLAGYVEIMFRFMVSALLRQNLLAHLFHRAGALPLPYGIGATISRFRDDVDVAEDTLDWTDEIVGEGIVTVVAIAILLATDAALTLAVIVPLVVVIAVAQRANATLGRYRAASSQATSDVAGAIGDLLTGTEALRAASAEDRAIARLRRLNRQRQALTIRDRLATQLLEAVTKNLSGLGTGLIMLLAATQLRSGRLTVGDFILFVAYLAYVASFTSGLGLYLAQFRQTTVAFERLQPLIGAAPILALTASTPLHLRGPLPDDRPPDATVATSLTSVTVTGLTYRHPDSENGIADVDLRLARGTLTVVTGRVGAGKTTLLRTLLGLLPAQSGEVRWNGTPVDDPATFFAPPVAAYTPQVPRLFSDTLRRNILLGVPDDPAVVAAAIHGAVLERDIATFPLGLETDVGTRGVALSGGQVQRSAVARMLARAAELLVIDDVSSALDPETERILWRRIRERPGVTYLAVSHRRAALLQADQIVVLRDGRVEGCGSLEHLLATSAEMRALWDATGPDDKTE